MPSVRRGKQQSTSLLGRPSPYNSGVTLFEAPPSGAPAQPASTSSKTDVSSKIGGDNSENKVGLRRSSRKKAVVKCEETTDEGFVDIEDTVRAPPSNAVKRTIKTDVIKTGEDEIGLTNNVLKSTTKRASLRKHKTTKVESKASRSAPEHWEKVIDLIRKMRASEIAPVDTMGCHMAGEGETDPKNARLSTLVSLMLSSQTKDEVCSAAVKTLRTALGGSISLEALLEASATTISQAIGKVGFWRKKTEYIMKTAKILRDKHEGDVPKTIEELCELPGVGEKMGFLTLHFAWGLNMGIGVDIHVHRITNRLGWHHPPTKTPEQTRLSLESWLPSEYHREINHLLVGFGQTLCQPLRPQCGRCLLNDQNLCPKLGVAKVSTSRKAKSAKDAAAVTIVTEINEEG